jgi:hypothetical protein
MDFLLLLLLLLAMKWFSSSAFIHITSTIQAEFKKNKNTLFYATTFAGYVGVLSGKRAFLQISGHQCTK